MQVFLPYISFEDSVEILDKLRLNKQLIEAWQILQININKDFSAPWANHSVVKMWRGYSLALIHYIRCVLNECEKRGINLKKRTYQDYREYLAKLDPKNWAEDAIRPPILKEESFYADMRKNLYRKGRADAICKTIKKHFKLQSINKWLISQNYPEKNCLKIEHILELEREAQENRFDMSHSYYQYFEYLEKISW